MTTLQKVRRTIETKRLLTPGDSVLVALSGGPDSVALLHILTKLRSPLRLKLGAVYLNHRIRRRAAAVEERFCRSLCERRRVEFHLVREDIPALAKARRQGIEETARERRYASFDRLADEHGYTKIALGHHADDQVETILFRLFRGAGPDGLRGMPVQRGRIIRPLLDLTREEILSYLKRSRLSWCEDASNRSVRYRRNYIRHRLLPAIKTALNPAVERAVLSLADTFEEEAAVLDAQTDRMMRRCVSVTAGGKFCLALAAFRPYAVGLRRRLLRRCVKATWSSGLAPDKDVVERLDALASKDSGALSLPDRLRAEVAAGHMYLFRADRTPVREVVEPGRPCGLDRSALRLSARVRDRGAVRLVKRLRARRVLMDWDRIEPPLVIRSVRPGDRFRPLGMTGAKKIGDYLTDRKVPRPLRDEVLILCDRQGPLWLLGFEIADRVKITSTTRKVLHVEYSVRKQVRRPAV